MTIIVDPEIIRNVSTIPIVCVLAHGPMYGGDLMEKLRGIAASQTVADGLNKLVIGGYVQCTVERAHGVKRLYKLTTQGNELSQSRLCDWRLDRLASNSERNGHP
jgi:DNA-binding HxlR family transcriptional regulator